MVEIGPRHGSEFKAREIVPLGNLNQDRVIAALGIVILFQLLPESMNLYPDDWIRLRIKILLPAKGFYANGVFLEAFGGSDNGPIRQELKQLLQCQGSSKGRGMNNPVNLLSTLFGRRCVTLRGCWSIRVCQ